MRLLITFDFNEDEVQSFLIASFLFVIKIACFKRLWGLSDRLSLLQIIEFWEWKVILTIGRHLQR